MTNSLLGTNCLKHIVAAIMYHKEWKSGKDAWLPCARNNFVPYAAPGDVAVGQRWKHWVSRTQKRDRCCPRHRGMRVQNTAERFRLSLFRRTR